MYGIEGVHYKVLEEGGASNGQDIITWADGLDASTSNYAKSGTWIMPNQFIGNVWEGSAPDVWDQQREFNDTAQKSAAFGFTYDSLPVTNEVTACTNVVSKYPQGPSSAARLTRRRPLTSSTRSSTLPACRTSSTRNSPSWTPGWRPRDKPRSSDRK